MYEKYTFVALSICTWQVTSLIYGISLLANVSTYRLIYE